MTLATLIAAIVLNVAGHAVPFTCQPQLAAGGEFGQYSPGPGVYEAVPSGVPGVDNIGVAYPDEHILLDNGICRSLTALIADPSGTRFHYTRPGARDWYETLALLTAIHESEHAYQYANTMPPNEAQAQCVAMKNLPHWLTVIGVPAARIARLERDAAGITMSLPPVYQGGSC